MFYKSRVILLIGCLAGLVAALPIQIKDIQHIFPPQNTILANGSQDTYETSIDGQVGDPSERHTISCLYNLNSEKADDPESAATPSENFMAASNFNDTTPLNGTIVEDQMEVKIYRPECDD